MDDPQKLGDEYQATFGNLDELTTAQIMDGPQLLALTRAEIKAVFPSVSWDEALGDMGVGGIEALTKEIVRLGY